MRSWYEKAEDEIDQELADGVITPKEHAKALRELRQEMQEEANQAAEAARDAYWFKGDY